MRAELKRNDDGKTVRLVIMADTEAEQIALNDYREEIGLGADPHGCGWMFASLPRTADTGPACSP